MAKKPAPATQPSAFAFCGSAADFLEVAQLAFRGQEHTTSLPTGLVPYYLLSHSIELALKAFLMTHGYRVEDLWKRDVGHDLHVLLDRAQAKGLGELLDPDSARTLVELVELLHEPHKARRFGYPEPGRLHSLPRGSDAMRGARALLDAVQTAIPLP